MRRVCLVLIFTALQMTALTYEAFGQASPPSSSEPGLPLRNPPGAPTGPPPSPPSEDALTIEPRRVEPGDSIKASGTGCRPESGVTFELIGDRLISRGRVESSASGFFHAVIEVPLTMAPGRVQVKATCDGLTGSLRSVQGTIAVARAPLVVTGVNVLFGLGSALVVSGMGIAIRRRPSRHGGGRSGGRSRRRRRAQ